MKNRNSNCYGFFLGTLWCVLLAGCTVPTPQEVGTNSATSTYYPDWMAQASFVPTFNVLDTQSSLGPYAEETKNIGLKDLIRMHGHPCDGLVTAACGIRLGLSRLYPDGPIDRTDTACITNNSPCYGDVAAYLTGGRIRFGTQKIDPSLSNEFILYRLSTNRAVKVSLRDGVFPQQVAELEKKLKSGVFTIEEMQQCQQLQWEYAKGLLSTPLEQSFVVADLTDFVWTPDPYIYRGPRGDIMNKHKHP
ncbi:formylmethanofuran dehydrogenase subunit E family protein [Planctomycetota bacterium]